MTPKPCSFPGPTAAPWRAEAPDFKEEGSDTVPTHSVGADFLPFAVGEVGPSEKKELSSGH